MVGFLDAFRGGGPLRAVTVLDFSQMMMGPVATQLIGDLGALVIKVERPVVGEWERSYLPQGRRLSGESPYFLAMNRNKLGLAADLKDPQDLARLLELIPHVDAVVHNYRPGVMERLGLGYDDLRALNPGLVYASGSGFGSEGPWVNRPGQDLLVQSASGLAADSGPSDVSPVPSATPSVDAATGFLLAFNIVAAVLDAQTGGAGREVRASLLGTALLMQCQQVLVTLNTDLRYERSGSGIAAPWTDAPYGVYPTADGHFTLSMVAPQKLAAVLDLPDHLLTLNAAETFAARDEITRAIRPQLLTRTTDEWLELMAMHDIWAAPLLTLEQALAEPQVAANHFLEPITAPDGTHVTAVGMAVSVSGVTRADRLSPPRIGEHTDLIWQTLAGLRSDDKSSQ